MGSKEPSKTDRRVQRTRRTLRESLIALILERGWDGISVQDICDRADVGRSTFYLHFADKEELLVGGFADLRRMLRSDRTTAAGPSAQPFRFVLGMIEHARENHRLFLALVGKRSGQLVLQRFRELVLDLIREDLARLPGKGQAKDALVHFVGGAFLELLTWWLEAKNPLEPAEMERIFLQMALPALKLVQG
jgi:AcrR family transcriptional regulator